MSTAENSFRTALVGGFNRQDVLNYIEQSARTANERIAALQRDLAEAQKGREAAEAALAEAQSRATTQAQEAEQTGRTLTERTASLTTLQSELVRVQGELTAAQAELGALLDQNERLRQGAEAYADLKDRTASIELEAHQRARLIEKEAAEKAKKIRVEAEQILYKVQAGYGRLRTDVDATVAHASGELGRVDRALESVKKEFADHDAELMKLLQAYRESSGQRPPEPVPLEEKEN